LADIDAALAHAAELTREGTVDLPQEIKSLKFNVDENLPTEYASIPCVGGFRSGYSLRRETLGCQRFGAFRHAIFRAATLQIPPWNRGLSA
jgi:hypothetical protein